MDSSFNFKRKPNYFPIYVLLLQVSVNFGPHFKFPPKDIDYKPVSGFSYLIIASAIKTEKIFLFLTKGFFW